MFPQMPSIVARIFRVHSFIRRALPGLALLAVLLPVQITSAPVSSSGNPMSNGQNFVISTWYAEDGLPHNTVSHVVRDPRGFLWIGTQGGLARFDGRYFVEYPMPEAFSKGQNDIRALVVEDEDTMLMLSGSGRLVRLRDGKYEPHPIDQFLREPIVPTDLAIDGKGALWIGAWDSSILRWDGKHLETFVIESDTPRRGIKYYVVTDAEKRTWIANGDFFGWYDNGTLRRYEPLRGHAFMLAASRTGGLWVWSREALSKIENGVCRTVPVNRRPLSSRVGIHETEDGTLWLATRSNGVFRLIDGKLDTKPALPQRVHSITSDINGNTWFGAYGGGLLRLKSKQYEILNTDTGMPTMVSSSITEDEYGALWCANQSGGVVRVQGNTATVGKPASGSAPFPVNVCADKRGTVWAGTPHGLLWTEAGVSKAAPVLHRFAPVMSNVQTLFRAGDGDIWVSWNNGSIGRIRDRELQPLTSGNNPLRQRVAGIVERQGSDGPELWFALRSGQLFQLTKDRQDYGQNKMPSEIEPELQIHTLHVDFANRLWLGTSKGLLLWRDDTPHLFTTVSGLPDNVIYQIASDKHGRLWASCRRGIFCIRIDDLLSTETAPGKQAIVKLFGRDDKLEGLSGMVGGQPMTCLDRNERLWFATYRGLVGFDTTDAARHRNPPPVYIDHVFADGTPVSLDGKAGATRIGPGAGQIEFAFAALSFSAPDRTRVRRMLEGFDLGWVDATGETSTTYSRLPPGKYIFRVEATDAAGGAQQGSAVLAIEIVPAWWQTTWFRTGLALAIIIVVALIARRVSNRLLRRRLRRLELEKALDKERTRIARDLHDELGSRMSQVGFIADSVCRKSKEPEQKEKLTDLAAQSRELVEDLHRVVWTVNPQNDSWQRMAAYISRYAQRTLNGTQTACVIDGVDTIPDIPVTPDLRHHIVAITKEALNNTLKYANATQVRIQMSADNGHFRMSISDNGRGFNPAALQEDGHYGLANMRERMAEAGGKIDIQSSPDKGTQITIDISLKYSPPRTY